MCKPLLTWSLTGATVPIQDRDIDSPMLSDENPPALVALVKFWVDTGCVQGKICNSLYGPAAKSLSSDARAATAEAFADELDQIHQRRLKTNAAMFGRQASTPAAELLVSGESVRHFGALTMALYAIPLNHPRSSRALETARKCLQVNRENSKNHMKSNNVYAWTVYCHWVLLDAPLTPFTGVFCNVIANPESSQEDLQLLEDFVASLQPAVPLSEGVEKFHQLCSIFVNVARAYVRAKAQQRHANERSDDYNFSQALQPAIGEFDELSAALGFFGPDFTASQDLTMGSEPGTDVSDGLNPSIAEPAIKPSLLDWQSGNVSLYGLLEQDLNDIACGNLGERQGNG
ncbi:hypothetical protein H2199_008596 [Coniosporium tulheliwenetii]|uniref:Uncharacterized protein n=1 Tax=Coniosporium tulheliwenetii TaxID=3383036 RepID=A0ACC2YID9_9PEZI|nr:hypothetical protein H2199_008596 [Cladosporium sp. JES 115]